MNPPYPRIYCIGSTLQLTYDDTLLDCSAGNVLSQHLQTVLTVGKKSSFLSQNPSQKNQLRFIPSLCYIFLSDLDSFYIIRAVPSFMIVSVQIVVSFLVIDAFFPPPMHSINQASCYFCA